MMNEKHLDPAYVRAQAEAHAEQLAAVRRAIEGAAEALTADDPHEALSRAEYDIDTYRLDGAARAKVGAILAAAQEVITFQPIIGGGQREEARAA